MDSLSICMIFLPFLTLAILVIVYAKCSFKRLAKRRQQRGQPVNFEQPHVPVLSTQSSSNFGGHSIRPQINDAPPTYNQIYNSTASRMPTAPPAYMESGPEVILSVTQMEHPAMPISRRSTIDEMEAELGNITQHAQACLQRYDSSHAEAVINHNVLSDRPPEY